jgi:2-polyprenyl-6-methoxyphenol hydroxylase-like FAD-dependent oxidoreductase
MRAMQQRTALISGAGVAGPAVAYWLNAAGWKTTIIERAHRPRSGGYVIDFWGLGYELAERMGLRAAVERSGYHVRELRVVGDQGQRLAGFGTTVFDELTDGRYVTLARSALARRLLEACTPPSTLRFGDCVVAVDDDGDGVQVRLRSGEERRFDLLIGADGLRSGVRRLVFGPDEQFERPLGYAVAAFEAEGYRPRDPDIYTMYGQPGRMAGRFTLHEDRTLFLFVFAHEGPAPSTLGAQVELVNWLYRADGWEIPEILRRLRMTSDLYLDSVSQIVAPAWSRGRVALLGDAAFCVSLLAGQGSALAMLAAYVLAGELAACDGRVGEAMANYEQRLRPFIESKQAGAVRMAGAFAPRTRFGLWFRNRVVNALDLPGIAKMVVGREIIDRFQLPEYPFGRPSGVVLGAADLGLHWTSLAERAASRASRFDRGIRPF